jgi:4-hydroxybenzoate polyprenyltransferase
VSRAAQLWRLARPRGLALAALAPLTGYAIAHWSRALPLVAPGAMLLLVLAWALLNAGTLWWNAAYDQDEGPVLYGETASVPPGLIREGTGALLLAVALAGLCDPGAGLAAGASALLAVGYSHPKIGWKARPFAGPLVNLLGFGILSPLAGYAVVGVPLDARSALLMVAVALSVLGAYFLAQSFQREEDAARGYRTLVVTAGPGATVEAARWSFRASHVLTFGLAAAGWIPVQCLAALPVCLWMDVSLARRAVHPEDIDERGARDAILLALLVGLLFVVGALAAWLWQVVHGLPLAGLGTPAGVPADAAGLTGWQQADAAFLRTRGG